MYMFIYFLSLDIGYGLIECDLEKTEYWEGPKSRWFSEYVHELHWSVVILRKVTYNRELCNSIVL